MPIETKRTFCRFCHASCAIEVDIDDNRVVAVRGDQADPIFGGYTCVKGRHLGDQHHHPDRLRTALKRRPDGGFEEIPTSQALDEIAERLQAIVAEHGPRAVASYSGTAVYGNAVGLPVGPGVPQGARLAVVLHVAHHRPARQDPRAAAPRQLGRRATNRSPPPTCRW